MVNENEICKQKFYGFDEERLKIMLKANENEQKILKNRLNSLENEGKSLKYALISINLGYESEFFPIDDD